MLTHTRKSVKTQCECNVCSRDLKLTSFYQASPIDKFTMQEHETLSGKKSFRMTSDIYMLFNQQRLDKLSREAILRHFDDMVVSNPSLSALKSRMSDSQLISLVKSRYIQSPSELLQWSRYLNSLADKQLQEFLTAKNLEQQKQSDSITPPDGDVPAEQKAV